MIPMRVSTIFKNRWWALLWAAGMIWLAVDVADSTKPAAGDQANNEAAVTDVTGQPVSDTDVQKFSDLINRT